MVRDDHPKYLGGTLRYICRPCKYVMKKLGPTAHCPHCGSKMALTRVFNETSSD